MQARLLIFISALCVLLSLNTKAQTFNVCNNSEVIFEMEDGYWGQPFWEFSEDSLNWESIQFDVTEPFLVSEEMSGYYRLRMVDESCDTSYVSQVEFIQVNQDPEIQLTIHSWFSDNVIPEDVDPFFWVLGDTSLVDLTFYVNDQSFESELPGGYIENPGSDFQIHATATHFPTGCVLYSDTVSYLVPNQTIEANALFDITGNFSLNDISVSSSIDSVGLNGEASFIIEYSESQGLDFLYAYSNNIAIDSQLVALEIVEPGTGFITMDNTSTAVALVCSHPALSIEMWLNFSDLEEQVIDYTEFDDLVGAIDNSINIYGYLNFADTDIQGIIASIAEGVLEEINPGFQGRDLNEYPLLEPQDDGTLLYDPNGIRTFYAARIYDEYNSLSEIMIMPSAQDIWQLPIVQNILNGLMGFAEYTSILSSQFVWDQIIDESDFLSNGTHLDFNTRLTNGLDFSPDFTSDEIQQVRLINGINLSLQMMFMVAGTAIDIASNAAAPVASLVSSVLDISVTLFSGNSLSIDQIVDLIIPIVGTIVALVGGGGVFAVVLVVAGVLVAAYNVAELIAELIVVKKELFYTNTLLGDRLRYRVSVESNSEVSYVGIPGAYTYEIPSIRLTEQKRIYEGYSADSELIYEGGVNTYPFSNEISVFSEITNTQNIIVLGDIEFEGGEIDSHPLEVSSNFFEWQLAWNSSGGESATLQLGLMHEAQPIPSLDGLNSEGRISFEAAIEDPVIQILQGNSQTGSAGEYLSEECQIQVIGSNGASVYFPYPIRFDASSGGGKVRYPGQTDEYTALNTAVVSFEGQEGVGRIEWRPGNDDENILIAEIRNPTNEETLVQVEFDVNTVDCGAFGLNIGDDCDDNDPTTFDDVINENCECEGIYPYPVANFTATPLEAEAPGEIFFMPETENGVDFIWNYGDGTEETFSSDLITNHTYQSPGIYTVSLTVVNQFGVSEEEIKGNYITISVPEDIPVADFSVNDGITTVDLGTSIQFEDESTGNPEIIEWDWCFDYPICGGSSGNQDPIFTYPQPGVYSVQLRVRNSEGWSIPEIKNNYITINEVFDCPDIEMNFGFPCDDMNDFTINDSVTEDCTCEGEFPSNFCVGLSLFIGDPCNDGDPTTTVDEINDNCECIGESIYDCPELTLNVGDPCDDDDPVTYNDQVDANCSCTGQTPVFCQPEEMEISQVINPQTGKFWMDRNLGASRVAISFDDEQAYGDLYQWGRFSDGHQCRNSETIQEISEFINPGHDDFILTTPTGSWLQFSNDSVNLLWQGFQAPNTPCPEGFRIPTEAEWQEEIDTWESQNNDGAFNSVLKFTAAGSRSASNGDISLNWFNPSGRYWTSTTNGTSLNMAMFDLSGAFTAWTSGLARGNSVRCIKGTVACQGVGLNIGDPCDDNDPTTTNDVINENCSCEGESIYDCPSLMLNFGDSCDDGDSETNNDVIQFNCECAGDYYPIETVHCLIVGATEVNEVINPETGKLWMDRNIGAAQVATSIDDELAYGDLYQWGRFSDGHQCRDSETTDILSSSIQPGHGEFIAQNSDWLIEENDDLWQGVNGLNNPCPPEFRLPYIAEFEAEEATWSSFGSEGGMSTPLKLPAGGKRNYNDGELDNVEWTGYYWSSTVIPSDQVNYSYGFNASYTSTSSGYTTLDSKSTGRSVRCIKETDSDQYDCPSLQLNIGDPCDDLHVDTFNDLVNSDCICQGEPAEYDCPTLSANIGDPCDDGNPDTENDIVNANCNCQGTPNQFDCPTLEANIGDPCDDGDLNTSNDVINENCECTGTYDCPELELNFEQGCDDGNPETFNDIVTENCTCQGQLGPLYSPGDPVEYNGNTYETIVLGNGQIWFKENLNTSFYNNGTAIPLITDTATWSDMNSGGYCYYDFNPSNGAVYGKLYNWFVIETEMICPAGWHAPNFDEFTELIEYLNGGQVAGGALKSTTLWSGLPPFFVEGNNSSGYTALPAGRLQPYYDNLGEHWNFSSLGGRTHFWIDRESESNPDQSWRLNLSSLGNYIIRSTIRKEAGSSIRCIKD